MTTDTICAPATAPANAALAIVRVSGADTSRLVSEIFSRAEKVQPRRAIHGHIIDNETIIDDVVLIFYQSPSSFTGEDMCEIFCHGNQLIVARLLSMLQQRGARMALPGEFSRRAFLSGRLDLTEAEAINHIINARSEWELTTSLNQMHGSLKRIVQQLREHLILLKADIEAAIDFVEEDIEFVSKDQARTQTEEIIKEIADLRRRGRISKKLSGGIDITIAGRPNVGKSSLLNLLTNSERAIVSDIPGTTRDVIREYIHIGGLHINLTDTAGINDTDDVLERQGIERSFLSIDAAAMILMVLDVQDGVTPEDKAIIEKIGSRPVIYILNKIDIVDAASVDRIETELQGQAIPFSAKTGEGLDRLEKELLGELQLTPADYHTDFIADQRIEHLLSTAHSHAEKALEVQEAGEPAEIIAFVLNELIETLSEITGEIAADDILDSIFSRFCIGK